MESILNVLLPYIVTMIGGYLVAQITKIVPNVIKLLIAKVGLANYNKMKTISWDIWKAIEEDGRLGELANSKLDTFIDRIKKQFPSITDDTIMLLNKSIANEVNKDKPAIQKTVESTVQEVPATIKYVAPDGTELVPAATTDTTITQ
jgi:hypothetical protein